MRVKQRTLSLSDSWFASLHPPRARTPARRCKHVCFGTRLRSCLLAGATLVRSRRNTGWVWACRITVSIHAPISSWTVPRLLPS